MKSIRKFLTAMAIASTSFPTAAALNVFACEPEWGSLARELAGDRAVVFSATTALQDPHRIEARPSLIARARSADLLVCTGAELDGGGDESMRTHGRRPRVWLSARLRRLAAFRRKEKSTRPLGHSAGCLAATTRRVLAEGSPHEPPHQTLRQS